MKIQHLEENKIDPKKTKVPNNNLLGHLDKVEVQKKLRMIKVEKMKETHPIMIDLNQLRIDLNKIQQVIDLQIMIDLLIMTDLNNRVLNQILIDLAVILNPLLLNLAHQVLNQDMVQILVLNRHLDLNLDISRDLSLDHLNLDISRELNLDLNLDLNLEDKQQAAVIQCLIQRVDLDQLVVQVHLDLAEVRSIRDKIHLQCLTQKEV